MRLNNGTTRAARAVDDLYRSHAGEVYRYAYAMLGNRADAEDVTQTTFVNALRALERGDRPRKPSNWLITITHNIVRQRFRQLQARPAEVELDHDVAIEESQGDGPSVEDLVRALQCIPPTQREALVMRELEGRSYKEIEAILELTPSALETLLFRARRSLAEELENLVTCERAELAMSKCLDSRLSRKERRRLDEHVRDCPSCARRYAGRAKHRRAFGTLALLPLPFSIPFFRDASTASAAGTAGGLSTIGAGGVTTAGGVTAAAGITASTCGSSCLTGLLAGGVAVKAVAVVAAATVAGSVGYEGVKHVHKAAHSNAPAVVASAQRSSPAPVAAAAAGASESVQSKRTVVDAVPLPDDPIDVISVPTSQAPPNPSLATVDGSQAAEAGPVDPAFVIVPPAAVGQQAPAITDGTPTNGPAPIITIALPPDTAPVKGPVPVADTTVVPVTRTRPEPAPTETTPSADTTPSAETTPSADTTPSTPADPDPTPDATTTPADPAAPAESDRR